MAWLSGWTYRKSKTISGSSAGTQTNYQLMLTVYKGTGTDTVTTIYCNNHLKNDFSDLRFTSSDGSTVLDYWIESYTSGSVATVWIEIPSIPASPSTATIYIYYDNSLATSLSNGTNTFDFYDHFEGSSLNSNWVQSDPGGSVSVSGSVVTFSGGGLGDWAWWRASNAPKVALPFIAEFYAKVALEDGGDTHSLFGIGNFIGWGGGDDSAYLGYNGDLSRLRRYYTSNNAVSTTYPKTTSLTSFTRVKIIPDGTTVRFYESGILTLTATTNIPDVPMGISAGIANPGAGVSIDFVFIHKYANPEPTFSATGAEETETCNYPSCNLIVLETLSDILSKQLSKQYPEYIDIDTISKLIGDNSDVSYLAINT